MFKFTKVEGIEKRVSDTDCPIEDIGTLYINYNPDFERAKQEADETCQRIRKRNGWN